MNENMKVTVAHSVEEIGRAAWDRLSAGRPFTSYRWYRYGEAVKGAGRPGGDQPLYLTLSRGGEPIARATCWISGREPFRAPKLLGGAARALLRRWPLMICRSPLAGLPGLILPEDADLADSALRALGQAALEPAREHHVLTAHRDELVERGARAPGWPDAYIPYSYAEPGTRLAIQWPDFDAYYESRSKKTRKNIRYNRRQVEHITFDEHDAPTDLEAAMPLIRTVENRYDAAPNPWFREMIEHAEMVDSVWVTAHQGEKLVGCELMLYDNGSCMVTALGRDYDVDYVYFVLGYTDIARAIADGAKSLRWGSCTYDAKERLGFELEDNAHIAFTSPYRPLRWLVRRFLV